MEQRAPRISHTGAVLLASALLALTLILFLDLGYPAYTWIKWLLSLGLFLTAGFYLQPRRRGMIQPTEEAGQAVETDFTPGVARKRGWVEIDRVSGTVIHQGKVDDVPLQDPECWDRTEGGLNISQADYFPPVSLNIGTVHLLAGVFFNPLAGIRMGREAWLYADALLFIHLIIALVVLMKEKGDPRKCVILLDEQGRPRYHPDPIDSLRFSVWQSWPMVSVLLLIGCAFVLNASGTLRYEGFHMMKLGFTAGLVAVVSTILTHLILSLSGLIWGSRGAKFWTFAAVFLSLFLATASSSMSRSSAVEKKPVGDQGGYDDEERNYRY